MQATFKQLRRQTGTVMRAVRRGESVVVTYRGNPVARMAPVTRKTAPGSDRLFGIWRDNAAAASVDEFMANVRKGRV